MEVTVLAQDSSDEFVFEKMDDTSVSLIDYTGEDNYITIPSKTDGYSVTEIGYEAFFSKRKISRIIVSDGVTTIGEEAFRFCEALQYIKLPDSITEIDKYALCDCINLEEVVLPSKLTTISTGLFSYCVSLTSVTIPNGVTSIGENAFYYCLDLTDVYFEGTEEEWNAITIGENNEYLTSATIHFQDYELGDVNEDGYINYLDAMSVLRYDAELITLTDDQLAIGDVNNDGEVNSLDAILILRYDAGLITGF